MVDRLPLLDARRVPRLTFAPRLDPRLHRELGRLDDSRVPIAETYRRVAAYARRHQIFRPSYEHVRRLVHDLRRVRLARGASRRSTAQLLFEVAYAVRPPAALIEHALEIGPTRPP